MAAKCRRLADAVSDGPTRDSLLKLADEYELRSPSRGTARSRLEVRERAAALRDTLAAPLDRQRQREITADLPPEI